MGKKNFIFGFLLCFSFYSLKAQQDLLLPVKSKGKWGYCDTMGLIQIPLQFELAGQFHSNGLAPVKMDGSSYLINKQGEIITKDRCQEIKVINTGIFACYNGNSWKLFGSFYNKPLTYEIKAIEPVFDSWVIHTPNGAGLINADATVIIEPMYDFITASNEAGYYIIYDDSLKGIANAEGKLILPVQYQFTNFSRIGIVIFSSSEKIGVMSLNEKVKTDTAYSGFKTKNNYPFVMLFDENIVTTYNVNTGKKFECNSTSGIDFFDTDYMMVFLPDGLNLLDPNMNLVFSEQYETIRREENGFVVSKNNLFGYADSTGKIIHPIQYDFISSIVQKTAIVSSKNLKGIIHTSGDVLAKPIYQKAEIYSSTAKLYSSNNIITIEFDPKGKIMHRSEFSNFKTISIGGFRDVRKPTQTSETPIPSVWFFQPETQKWGLNSPTGELLLLPQFDVIERWNGIYTKVGIVMQSSIRIGRHTFVSRYVWGLVNQKTGEIIYKPSYIDIHIDTSGNAETIILVDNGGNFYMKDPQSKQLHGPFTWIGPSNGITRPVAEKGTLNNCGEDTTYTKMGDLYKYVDNHFTPNTFWRSNTNPRAYIGDIVLVDAKFYLWDIKSQSKLKMPYNSNYISPFIQGYARCKMSQTNQFGVIDRCGNIVVPAMYDNIEIIKSDQSVFFLKYKKRRAYGFIKTNGAWAFEKKFEENGFFSEGLAFMGRNDSGLVVCVDSTGNVRALNNISRHGYFSEGLVPIKEKRKWYYLDNNFTVAMEDETWEWAGQFSQGRAPVKIDSRYHYINDYGYKISKTPYEKAETFSEYGAIVKQKGKWGVVNTACEYIIKRKYNMIKYKVSDSLYHCRTDNGWLLYNTNGTLMNKKKIQYVKPFVDGHALAVLSNGQRGILRKDGSFLQQPKNIRLMSVQGEFITMTMEDGKIYLGNTAYSPIANSSLYSNYKHGSDGIIFAKAKRGGWAMLNISAQVISKISGSPISGFRSGYAIASVGDGKKMYLNKDGTQAFGMFFLSAFPFENGMARVCTEKGWGVVDVSGNFVIHPKYKYISPFKNGYASVQLESLISIADADNKPLVDGEYDTVVLEPFGFFRIESADKVGWISKQGRIIWNPAN